MHCLEGTRNAHCWGRLRTDAVGMVAPGCRAELHWVTCEFTSSSLAPRHAQHTYGFTGAFGGAKILAYIGCLPAAERFRKQGD